jgi:hypothetical protein
MTEDRRSHHLQKALDDFTVSELEPAERECERLSDRPDWQADQARERLGPILTALYSKRDSWLRHIAVEEEREQLLDTLIPLYRQELAALTDALTAIAGALRCLMTRNSSRFAPAIDGSETFGSVVRDNARCRISC